MAAPLHVATLLLAGVGVHRRSHRYRLDVGVWRVVIIWAITDLLLGNYLVDFCKVKMTARDEHNV